MSVPSARAGPSRRTANRCGMLAGDSNARALKLTPLAK